MLLLQPAVQARLVDVSELSTFSGARIAFWIAAIVLLGALATITRKNPIAAVMSLVATFFGLAATYALLSAHFLAALQVLVYAGAIMVLFIFVVMVLNRDEVEPIAVRGAFTKAVGVAAVGYLVVKLGYQLSTVLAPMPGPPPPEFGTVAQVGNILFTDYLFAFEMVSVLLLIAVIAAVVVARAHKREESPEEPQT